MQLDRIPSRAFVFRMAIGAPTHLPLSRREVVDQIDALFSILDRFDGDPDEEPCLGWPERHGVGLSEFDIDVPHDDREDDAGDNGEMDDDREPLLGWTDHPNQSATARYGDHWRTEEDEDGTGREREDHR